ncbi:MAG: hypothetical protein ACP5R5_09445 [Armatimonadota bacterium]
MADENGDILSSPDTCDETVEYDNIMLDSIDIDPDYAEEDSEYRRKWEEIEQKFARYERNYRLRRIRELTKAPLIVKSRSRGRRKKLPA